MVIDRTWATTFAVANAALSGGAIPTVVVSPDPDGRVASALSETDAQVLAPRHGTEPGIGWFALGVERALELVTATSAALLWPGRLTLTRLLVVAALTSVVFLDRKSGV